MRKQHIAGLSLAVVRSGKIIKAKGYGLANVELNVEATPETVYRIGSLSKQFIAAGVMLLNEESEMNVEDKVSKYLEGTPANWKEITVHHLLTHTSGLIREAPGFDPFKIQKEADVIKTAYPLPLLFAPGEKWEYSNIGYFALAEIIHNVSGKQWDEYIAERVFRPSGMTATRTTSLVDIIPKRAAGYDWNGSRLQNAEPLIALRPSGAFLSTVLDLAKWDAALYTDKILKQGTRDQMWKPAAKTTRKLDEQTEYFYGYGWQVAQVSGHRLLIHNGTQSGFRAVFARFVDDKLSVIILTNGGDASRESIALGIAALYISGLTPANAK